MPQQINIPCHLTITPGTDTVETRITLITDGRMVIDTFENELTVDQLEVFKQIAACHAKIIDEWARS